MTSKSSDMNPLSQTNPVVAPFLKVYTKTYEENALSLDKTSALCEKHLDRIAERYRVIDLGLSEKQLSSFSQEEKNKDYPSFGKAADMVGKHSQGMGEKLQTPEGREEIISGLRKDKKLLIEMREVCALSIAAKQHYYDHTLRGKIAQVFQRIGQALGFQTSMEKAINVLARCNNALDFQFRDQFLKSIDQSLPAQLNSEELKNEANLNSAIGIMRTCAVRQKRDIYAAPGECPAFPNHILIAKKNGDVIAIDVKKGRISKGASRHVYKALRYSIGQEPKEIAIISSYNYQYSQHPDFLDNDMKKDIKDVNSKIKNEYTQVQKLHGINGIINTQRPITIKIDGTDFTLAVMDLYSEGSLKDLLLNTELDQRQKKHLIISITLIVQEIHKRGQLHRDIKLDNILVVYDYEKDLYEATFIDFENSCSITADIREFASTPQCWPPEYVNAYLTPSPSVPKNVPSTALDIWNLGLVCYKIWYGEDFISNPEFGYHPIGLDPKTICAALFPCFQNINKCFPESLEPMDKMIQGMLDPNPAKRKLLPGGPEISFSDDSTLSETDDGLLLAKSSKSKTSEALTRDYIIPRDAAPIAEGERWTAYLAGYINSQGEKEQCVILRSKARSNDPDLLQHVAAESQYLRQFKLGDMGLFSTLDLFSPSSEDGQTSTFAAVKFGTLKGEALTAQVKLFISTMLETQAI